MSTQVVGAKDGSLVLYENVGPTSVPDFGPRGGFISPVAAVESSGNGAPSFGDVDGDGDIDLLLSGDGDTRVFLLLQGADRTFETVVLDDSLPQAGGMKIRDFDGDGRNELVVSGLED